MPVSFSTALLVKNVNPAYDMFPDDARVIAGPIIAVDWAQPDKIIPTKIQLNIFLIPITFNYP